MVELDTHGFFDIHFNHGTNGVALMMRLWATAMTKQGFEAHTACSGLPDTIQGIDIPEMSYQTEEQQRIRSEIFTTNQEMVMIGNDSGSAETLEQVLQQQDWPEVLIETMSNLMYYQLKQYIIENNISLVFVRNIFSLPLNFPLSLAVFKLIKDPELAHVRFVLVNHDFYWESSRAHQYVTHDPKYLKLLAELFPLQHPKVLHAVINSSMQTALEEKFGLQALLLPDMDDFFPEEESLVTTENNRERPNLREHLNLQENDLMVMMPARVVPRKAIEFAVEFVSKLQEPHNRKRLETVGAEHGIGVNKRAFDSQGKIVLVLPQGEDLEDSREYADALQQLADEKNVTIIFAGEFVRPDVAVVGPEDQRVPFYDVYKAADLVIYPTVSEGFGNQLLEMVKAGVLPILFEYPVFREDIKQYLKHFVSLGSEYTQDGPEYLHSGTTQRMRVLPEEAYNRAIEDMLVRLADPETLAIHLQENYQSIAAQFSADAVVARFLAEIGLRLKQAETNVLEI